jgi:HSP20 family molecular chaperone IbpA
MNRGTEVAVQERPTHTPTKTRAPEPLPLSPAVDIFEDATGITLFVDMPGVSKDRLDVRVEADRLFLEGRAAIEVPEGFVLYHAEVRESAYRRSFVLGPELDTDAIEANLKDGVLTLRIPRLQKACPRRIEIKTSTS